MRKPKMLYADTVFMPALRARGVTVVDLRAQLPRNTTWPLVKNWATRPLAAITLCAWHYDASPLRPDWPYDPIARYDAEARAHIAMDWGGGYHAPTIAYHGKIAADGAYYVLNDFEFITWNANDANGQDVAVCVDLGVGQQPTPAQLVTVQRVAQTLDWDCPALPVYQSEHYGHGELTWLSNATSCPGSLLPFIQRYRATGSVFDATEPPPPEVLPMLTDQELAAVVQCVWGDTPFIPDFAIPKAWLTAYRDGRYLGRPLGGEADATDDLTFQEFDRGLICYRKSDGYVSSKG